jgi:hypothetical protein
MSNFNLNNFNDLINQANQLITCGPECSQNQKTMQLEQNYLDAQTNVISAPQQLVSAEKNYITYTTGESGYNEFLDKQLEEKADTIAKSYQANFDSDVNIIKQKNNVYDGLVVNYNNLIDLYKKYKIENDKMIHVLKNKSSDILTNDRKTYYEDQGITTLKTYYFLFLCIYIFIVVVFLLSIILVKSNVKFTTRIFILVFMVLYPFLCYGFFHLLYKLFNQIRSYFPSNAYRNI